MKEFCVRTKHTITRLETYSINAENENEAMDAAKRGDFEPLMICENHSPREIRDWEYCGDVDLPDKE